MERGIIGSEYTVIVLRPEQDDSGFFFALKQLRSKMEAWQSWFIAPVLKTDDPERGP